MATVKFSADLRDQIVNAAKKKFQSMVNVAQESSPKDWGDRLYDFAFGQYTTAIAALPADFFQHKDTLSIRSVGNVDRISLSYKLSAAKPFPFRYPKGCLFKLYSSYGDEIAVRNCPEIEPFKVEVIEWQKRVFAAVEKQKEFGESVQAIVNGFATLAPALKHCPPLWELLTDATKDKHRLIVEREKKEVDLGIDLDRATALATFSKIRGDK